MNGPKLKLNLKIEEAGGNMWRPFASLGIGVNDDHDYYRTVIIQITLLSLYSENNDGFIVTIWR